MSAGAFLAAMSISCERWTSTSLAVDGIVEGSRPENALAFDLAAGSVVGDRPWYSFPAFGELELDGDVARDYFAAVQVEARLEALYSVKGMAWLRLPELCDRLRVNAMDISGTCIDLRSLRLPVVFGRRGDAVAVVALADFVGASRVLRALP